MVFKLSIVIPGSEHAGAITDALTIPNIGDRLFVGDLTVEVVEVTELLPPRGELRFVHVTCKIVEKPDAP